MQQQQRYIPNEKKSRRGNNIIISEQTISKKTVSFRFPIAVHSINEIFYVTVFEEEIRTQDCKLVKL